MVSVRPLSTTDLRRLGIRIGTPCRHAGFHLENPSGQSELIQLKASWYPDHGLASTLGFEHAGQQATSVPSLGTSQSAAETIRCFGCHATYLPLEHERIDFQNMTAGVWCSRCHLNSREHVAAAELGQSVSNSWSTASPLTSINRCGECHRRVDEFPARRARSHRSGTGAVCTGRSGAQSLLSRTVCLG